MAATINTLNALSFDIEDWFHLLDIPTVADASQWHRWPSLVERYTYHILDLLEEHHQLATFFVVGWVANRYPQLVHQISKAGHEVASHSYWHRPVRQLSPHTFRDDLRQSVTVLENLTGRKIHGYRAPGFSIGRGQGWALDILLEQGIAYDASLIPSLKSQHGYPCPRTPSVIITNSSNQSLRELPVSIMSLGQRSMIFCGGGYLRLFPISLIEWFMHKHNRAGIPNTLYLHPRDFAVDCPRVAMSWDRRFRCYVGLRSTQRKLRQLLRDFTWGTCAQVVGLSTRQVELPPVHTCAIDWRHLKPAMRAQVVSPTRI